MLFPVDLLAVLRNMKCRSILVFKLGEELAVGRLARRPKLTDLPPAKGQRVVPVGVILRALT